MSATRLSDLAHSLGLNIATVSRALRDDPRVKRETRERIRAEAQRLGYRPHVAARALAEGRTRTLWFVIADLADAIAREPAVFASQFLLEQGYDLLLAQHHNDEAVFRRILERLSRGGADGAIIIPDASSQGTADSPLWEAKVPFVYLDRTLEGGQGAPVVTTDNHRAGASLVEALAKLEGGAPDVVVNGFGFPYRNSAELARRAGVDEAARVLGLSTVSAGQSWASYRRAVVLASTEETALGLAKPLTQVAGLGVFDHWRSGPRPGTKILVAVQDFRAMARAAVACILAQLRGEDEAGGEVLVPLAETLEVK
jgi:DNA-binding LacI/PurR family transcriptional regulator